MLKEILKVQGISELGKQQQSKIMGGNIDVSEEDCLFCGAVYVAEEYYCAADYRHFECLESLEE